MTIRRRARVLYEFEAFKVTGRISDLRSQISKMRGITLFEIWNLRSEI